MDGPNPDVNFGASLDRLKTALTKLRKEHGLLEKYSQIMADQLALGIIEPSPFIDHSKPQDRLYYMPHQPVIKESSVITELRVLYDCSAGNPYLNDCSYRGAVCMLVKTKRQSTPF